MIYWPAVAVIGVATVAYLFGYWRGGQAVVKMKEHKT
jgi:hypothetical protein